MVGKKRKGGEALCYANNQMGLILDQAISDPGVRRFAHGKNVNMKQ